MQVLDATAYDPKGSGSVEWDMFDRPYADVVSELNRKGFRIGGAGPLGQGKHYRRFEHTDGSSVRLTVTE